MTLDGLRADVHFALRMMRRAPFFTAMTMVVLALGIGSTGVIFAAVDNVLLRPLPYRSPSSLVMIWSHNTNNGAVQNPVSPADLTATIYHALGVTPNLTLPDREGRLVSLTEGTPVLSLFG